LRHSLFWLNLFQRINISIDVPSSNWSAERLVKVLFLILEAYEKEFHALSKYALFTKICVPEYCLKLPFASLSLLA